MKTISFNINDCVKVKLTPEGRKHLEYRHTDLYLTRNISVGKDLPIPKFKIKETRAGWSTWQLWDLMSRFSGVISPGCPLPFATEIKILKP